MPHEANNQHRRESTNAKKDHSQKALKRADRRGSLNADGINQTTWNKAQENTQGISVLAVYPLYEKSNRFLELLAPGQMSSEIWQPGPHFQGQNGHANPGKKLEQALIGADGQNQAKGLSQKSKDYTEKGIGCHSAQIEEDMG